MLGYHDARPPNVEIFTGSIQAFPTNGMDLSLLIHQPADNSAKDTVDATARLHKCGNSVSGQLVSAKSQIAEDTRAYDNAESFDEDEDEKRYGGGGGGGGARVGSQHVTSPLNLPSGRATYKKFAWVP